MASNGKQWILCSQGLGGRLESTCTFSVVLGTATFQWIRDMWFQSGSFLQHSTASSHPSPAPDDLCPHCRRYSSILHSFMYPPTRQHGSCVLCLSYQPRCCCCCCCSIINVLFASNNNTLTTTAVIPTTTTTTTTPSMPQYQ